MLLSAMCNCSATSLQLSLCPVAPLSLSLSLTRITQSWAITIAGPKVLSEWVRVAFNYLQASIDWFNLSLSPSLSFFHTAPMDTQWGLVRGERERKRPGETERERERSHSNGELNLPACILPLALCLWSLLWPVTRKLRGERLASAFLFSPSFSLALSPSLFAFLYPSNDTCCMLKSISLFVTDCWVRVKGQSHAKKSTDQISSEMNEKTKRLSWSWSEWQDCSVGFVLHSTLVSVYIIRAE